MVQEPLQVALVFNPKVCIGFFLLFGGLQIGLHIPTFSVA